MCTAPQRELNFWRFGALRLEPKSIKNRFIRLSKTRSNFEWILYGSWIDFGSILDAKLGPSWFQNQSKIDPNIDQKNNWFLNRFWLDFGWILASNLGRPGGVDEWLVSGFWPLGAFLGPRWPQEPSKRPPGRHFRRFLVDVWASTALQEAPRAPF